MYGIKVIHYQNDTLEDGPENEYLTDRLAREAVEQLEVEGDNRPFFMAFWSYQVHSPFQGKDEYIRKYEKKTDPYGIQNCPTMGAMVQSMDDALGTIRSALEEKGLAENTIIIFMSDNGPSKGKVNGVPVSSAEPLRGMKGSVYEGGYRVPLIVHWPGRVTEERICHDIVTSTDLYTTILEMAGLTPKSGQPVDSESFVPLLDGSESPTRETFFCHYPQGPAYVRKEGEITAGAPHHVASTTVRRGPWKLIRRWDTNEHFPVPFELYNLEKDQGESQNLAEDYPELVKELDRMISDYLVDTQALVPQPNPDFDPATREGVSSVTPPEVYTSFEA